MSWAVAVVEEVPHLLAVEVLDEKMWVVEEVVQRGHGEALSACDVAEEVLELPKSSVVMAGELTGCLVQEEVVGLALDLGALVVHPQEFEFQQMVERRQISRLLAVHRR